MFKSYPDFRSVLHSKEEVVLAVDRHEFHHAVPEADIVLVTASLRSSRSER